MSSMFCVGTVSIIAPKEEKILPHERNRGDNVILRVTDISACNPHSSFPTATVLPVPSVLFRRR